MLARWLIAALLVWPVLLFAEPSRTDVAVAMFAMPETLWQEDFEGLSLEDPALFTQLDAEVASGSVQMPVDLLFRLVGDGAVVQRKGVEEEFAEGWDNPYPQSEAVVPIRKTKRFIGTTVELAQQPPFEGGTLRVKMNLEHHIAPPRMHSFNFANAATGTERDRLSVTYPQFEKLEWRGELSVSQEWRLVANVLHFPVNGNAEKPPTRFLIFIKRA